ncbi:hypothetical protein D9M69_496930 [compost metagenome]
MKKIVPLFGFLAAFLAISASASSGAEGSRAGDLVKNSQHYANQNLGISQPNTDGDKPAAYR